MYKISGFTITEPLQERIYNDDSVRTLVDDLHCAEWGLVGDDLSSGPVAGANADRIRKALQVLDPTGTGWNECDLTRCYRFVETGAPASYDGFGSFTVGWKKDESGYDRRVVAVRIQHLDWQRARYGSGLFAAKVQDACDLSFLKTP